MCIIRYRPSLPGTPVLEYNVHSTWLFLELTQCFNAHINDGIDYGSVAGTSSL